MAAYDDGRILLGQYDRFWLIDPGVSSYSLDTKVAFAIDAL